MGGSGKKLLTAARLWFLDRAKFGRSCRACRDNVYDEKTGKVELTRVGLPMVRPAKASPPCYECPKTMEEPPAARSWVVAIDPPGWAYRAFRHWRELAAVGFSGSDASDPIVRRTAALFQSVKDAVEGGQQGALFALLGLKG